MVRPYRFSLEEFLRLPLPERGVELLRGEIYQMAPIGSRHADLVDRWAEVLLRTFSGRARVRIQGPFTIPPDTYLEPDLLLCQLKDYRERYPVPDEVLLAIEVACRYTRAAIPSTKRSRFLAMSLTGSRSPMPTCFWSR